MKLTTRAAILALSAAETALAHSGFTNFFVNGKNQGDAVCVRMNTNPSKWNSPIADITGTDLACGYSGTIGVNRVCPVPDGATITFEWRQSANKPGQGVIDPSHKGPCAVYAKKVDSAISDKAAGDGWFKLWHEGYDETAGKWCTEKLIASGGLMTVSLPKGLVGGYYLLRSEILALHSATQGDPQYYTSCAQVFIESSGNLGPASTVAIPGQVSKSDKSDSFNIYESPMKLPYPIPGPELAKFQASSAKAQTTQTEGLKPADCIDESGSNWCGVEVPKYVAQSDCWESAKACWAQADLCWKSTPATGGASCQAWQDKCKGIQGDCEAKRAGPADAGKDITPVKKDIIPPPPLGSGSAVGGSASTPAQSQAGSVASVAAGKASGSAAAAPPSAVAKAPADNYYPSAGAPKGSAAPSAVVKAPADNYYSSASAPKGSAAASAVVKAGGDSYYSSASAPKASAAPAVASPVAGQSTVTVTVTVTAACSVASSGAGSGSGSGSGGNYGAPGSKASEAPAVPKPSGVIKAPSSPATGGDDEYCDAEGGDDYEAPKPSAVIKAPASPAKPSTVADPTIEDGESCDADGDDINEAPQQPGAKSPNISAAASPAKPSSPIAKASAADAYASAASAKPTLLTSPEAAQQGNGTGAASPKKHHGHHRHHHLGGPKNGTNISQVANYRNKPIYGDRKNGTSTDY